MLPSEDIGVERGVKAEVVHHISRPPRAKKVDPSSTAKGHHHQISRPTRPPQPPKRKDKVKTRETQTEDQNPSSQPMASEAEAKMASTVVNVDLVREKEEPHEELLGLLESNCQEDGKPAEIVPLLVLMVKNTQMNTDLIEYCHSQLSAFALTDY